MMKKYRLIIPLVCGSLLFLLALFLPLAWGQRLLLYIAAYLVCGWEVLVKSARNISKGRVFDENFLMSIATLGAFAVGQYPEGVAVMLFYQVGELFEDYALDKSRACIAGLMSLRPEFARVLRRGKEEIIPPQAVQIGELILIRPGEKIPLDGVVEKGTASLDTSALTGEFLPQDVSPGQSILSGFVNLNGVLEIRASKSFGQSAVSKILELVQSASIKKTKMENWITRFARYYTPVVVAAALLVAVVPPLVLPEATFQTWVYRALIFLVLSCPCAVVLSVPLGFFGGLGGAARNGVLIKGSNYLEMLAHIHTLVFDKTGTLTQGSFQVSRIVPVHGSEANLLELAALAQSASNHPIAQSLQRAYGKKTDTARRTSALEIPGKGIRAMIDGQEVLAGNRSLLKEHGVFVPAETSLKTAVYVAINSKYAGSILLSDRLKKDAKQAILALRKDGVKQMVLLTGDHPATAEEVRKELHLDEAHGALLPAEKLAHLERLLLANPPGGFVAFVGDGVNDAPVLARADIGIAMGALGSDAAIEAADVILMTDEPSKVAVAAEISRMTLKVVKQNIFFALGIKAAVLGLGVFGMATMWEAVFADVGVCLLAVLNSLRPLYYKAKAS